MNSLALHGAVSGCVVAVPAQLAHARLLRCPCRGTVTGGAGLLPEGGALPFYLLFTHPFPSGLLCLCLKFARSRRAGSGCFRGRLAGCAGSGLRPCSSSHSSRCWLQTALSYRAPSTSMVSAARAGFFLTPREGKCMRLVPARPQTYTEFEHQNALSSSRTAGSAKRHGALHVVPHERCKGCGFSCAFLGVSCFVDSRNPNLPSSGSGSTGTFRWSMPRARAGCPARCEHASVALPIHHFLPDSSEYTQHSPLHPCDRRAGPDHPPLSTWAR